MLFSQVLRRSRTINSDLAFNSLKNKEIITLMLIYFIWGDWVMIFKLLESCAPNFKLQLLAIQGTSNVYTGLKKTILYSL